MAGLLALLVLVLAAGRARAASGACTGSTQVNCVFSYTGGSQAWTVPAGIKQATFTLYGAEGAGASGGGLMAGGIGAEVNQTLALTPGTVLQVNAGGTGTKQGAFGGGGTSGNGNGGGGGASDVRSPAADGSYPLADRLLVAAGGGGAGFEGVQLDGCVELTPLVPNRAHVAASTAGASVPVGLPQFSKGGDAGSPGVAGEFMGCFAPGTGGAAGTLSGPGAGGAGGALPTSSGPPSIPVAGSPGASGSLGAGGAGGIGGGPSAGGGGGGYYGGGGGGTGATYIPNDDNPTTIDIAGSGSSGGGGGGSSYPATASITNAVPAPDDAPNGEVIISYTRIATSIRPASGPNPSAPGQVVKLGAMVRADGGTVTFTDGGSPISGCSALPVTGQGTAACFPTFTAAGSHTIQATYSGDGLFAPSSATLTQVVQ